MSRSDLPQDNDNALAHLHFRIQFLETVCAFLAMRLTNTVHDSGGIHRIDKMLEQLQSDAQPDRDLSPLDPQENAIARAAIHQSYGNILERLDTFFEPQFRQSRPVYRNVNPTPHASPDTEPQEGDKSD